MVGGDSSPTCIGMSSSCIRNGMAPPLPLPLALVVVDCGPKLGEWECPTLSRAIPSRLGVPAGLAGLSRLLQLLPLLLTFDAGDLGSPFSADTCTPVLKLAFACAFALAFAFAGGERFTADAPLAPSFLGPDPIPTPPACPTVATAATAVAISCLECV